MRVLIINKFNWDFFHLINFFMFEIIIFIKINNKLLFIIT